MNASSPPDAALRPRRFLLPVVVLAALALSLNALLSRPDLATWRARQVVLVSIDPLRADRLGTYGYAARPTSPNLDMLARQSVVFERAYAAAPGTIPALAGMLTGRRPVDAGASAGAGGVGADAVTLAELFRAHGVATATFNSHADLVGKHGGFRRGFDTVVPEQLAALQRGLPKASFAATEPALMAWLEAHAREPFFVWIHDTSPHLPETPGNSWLSEPGWERYDAEVRHSDDRLGRILRKLAELRIGDDLLLVVTGCPDEASPGGAPGAGGDGGGDDEALRVPLLIGAPVFEARRVATPVALVDLYPTIAALAGLPTPPTVRGESLVPLLAGAGARLQGPSSDHPTAMKPPFPALTEAADRHAIFPDPRTTARRAHTAASIGALNGRSPGSAQMARNDRSRRHGAARQRRAWIERRHRRSAAGAARAQRAGGGRLARCPGCSSPRTNPEPLRASVGALVERRMARRLRLAVLAAIVAAARAAAAEVSLDLSSATVAHPGDSGRLCVSLATGGADVAGTQNDLVWDGRCATLPDEGACAVAGTHGKELHSRIQSNDDFRLRALILSLSDVAPIADGVLYCCEFAVQAAPGACCTVAIDDGGASDSRGNQVDVIAGAGELCVAGAGGASPTPTATPRPPANDDDGCQIATPGPGVAAPWLVALALLLLRRRR